MDYRPAPRHVSTEGNDPMLDIQTCIQEREATKLTRGDDVLLESLLNSGESTIFCVLAPNYFNSGRKRVREIKKEWHLSCAIDLGRVLPDASIRFTLFGLSRMRNDHIAIARWLGKESAGVSSIQSDDFNRYLAACEQVVNTGIVPHDSTFAEYAVLDESTLIDTRWDPGFYQRKYRELRCMLEKENVVPLSELAEIHIARSPAGHARTAQAVPTLRASDIAFPFSPDTVQLGPGSNVELETGDVVLSMMGDANRALVYTGDGGTFAGSNLAVLRTAHGVSPEYLCLYLSSNLARDIAASLKMGFCVPRIMPKDLQEFPVILPNLDESYYRTEYEKLSHPNKRDYIPLERLKTGQPTDIESILDAEYARKVQAHNEKQLREFLQSDIHELNTCFANGAYKAAIVLAGSILEAVLIDWLSEIHGKNFFNSRYRIKLKNGNTKDATLENMIDEIEELEKPDWAEEAKCAHKIKYMRNRIHADLCIRTQDVNEQAARMVIECLDKVLRTRGSSCLE